MAKYTKETTLYRKSELQDALDKAGSEATSYVTDITGGGISVHQAGDTAGGNTLIKDDGVHIRKGDDEVARFTASGARIGMDKTGSSHIDITQTEFNMVDQNGRRHVHFETPVADESSSTITYYMSDDYEREMGTANMSGLYYDAQSSGETQSFSTTLPDVVSGVKKAAAYVQGSSSSFLITDDDTQDVYYTYSSDSHTLSVYVTPAASSSYPFINDFAFLLTLNTVLYSAQFGAYGERGRSDGIVFSVANGTPQSGSDAFTVDYTGNVTAKSYNGHTIGSDVPAGVSLAYLPGTYKGSCFSGGYITGSAMSYRWEIPLERPVVGTITECTCEFTIRSGGKTHYTDKTVTFKPGTTGSRLVQEPGGIRILWSASTAVSGATTNSAIGVDCSYTFKVE